MQQLTDKTIDMTLAGDFVDAPPPPFARQPPRDPRGPQRRPPWQVRLAGGAVLVAVLSAAATIVIVSLWLAAVLIPVVITAALLGYGFLRFQLWRARSR